jgi:hypothetical protein
MRRPIFTGSKLIIVKAFAMTQQTEMFIRLVLLGEIPMAPNANGLFTVDQVAALASKRGCSIHKAGDITIEIKHPGQGRGQWKHASIIAHDRGLWHPVNIFRACRQAARQPHYEIDYAKAKIKNPDNLDEVRIAQVVGADGVRPYLSRPSKYSSDDFGVVEPARNGVVRAVWTPGAGPVQNIEIPNADAGNWTWPMLCIMAADRGAAAGGKSSDYRRALRALDDAGLLKLTVGPRGGFGTATFEWLPLAFLQPIERPAPELDPVDVEALNELAAV